MRTVYFTIEDCFSSVTAGNMKETLQVFMDNCEVDGTANWYYDEFVEPTEYGVRVRASGQPLEVRYQMCHEMAQLCTQLYDCGAGIGVRFS